ncbi:unnamed protein product [Coregonus sp. 'balchen']|nr:unnamed protein product [Coregonus sp. 'balchen']
MTQQSLDTEAYHGTSHNAPAAAQPPHRHKGPVSITINVLDVNNHAPSFNQTDYNGIVKERTPAGVPFARVFATDLDDPESPNAHLSYTLVSQIPNRDNTLFFQINSNTGDISTTAEGERLLKAREGVVHSRGGDFRDSLKKKFDEYCTPTDDIPYELNPFYSCVQRAESRRLNPLEDPDFTLIVRVEDMGGESLNALNGNARVNIAVQENLWVQSNDPSALYRLVQKERELTFPFNVTEEGDILLTEELDREDKAMYILVVFAEDSHGNEVDPPLEVQVVVDDVNDNPPICEEELSSPIGDLMVHDADDINTPNALLSYSLVSQTPSSVFTIDGISGRIQAKQMLQRRDATEYHLTVRVNDPGFSTECKVLIKVIDINNELPIFEMNDYGSHNLSEDTAVGHTLLTLPHRVPHNRGQQDGVFAMETDDNGEGRLVVAKIDARNPEPLVKGLEYGAESSAVVSLAIIDVDEAPVFAMDILDVAVPEDTKEGATLLKINAKDPEGKEILFKMEGDTKGWLEIDPATGEIKIKNKAVLDRETVEAFHFTVVAFEKANPELSSEREVSVRLLDVNDNVPKLTENQAFICVKKPQPIVLTALDADADPFGAPFTFSLAQGKKSPNWDLSTVDGTSAKLTLKKSPSEDKTFLIPINIKDNAGMGITQKFEVRVCNCTELGYCFTKPDVHAGVLGMPTTVGILAGTVGFIALVLVIAFHRIKKDNQKKALQGETDAIL